jgi:hypothetical protein
VKLEEIVDESAPWANKKAAIEAEAREDDKVKMAEFCAWWSEPPASCTSAAAGAASTRTAS